MTPPGNGRRPRRAAVVAVVAALAVPATAGVQLFTGDGGNLHWDLGVEQPNVKGGAITWFADAGGSEEEPPGDEVESDAIAAALDAWSGAPGSRVRFAYDASRPAYDPKVSDRVNLFTWRKHRLGPFTLAVSFVESNNGVITDSDTMFNDTPEFVLWSTTEQGLPGYADVRAVATHEIGHLLGLDHSPVMQATMAPLLPTGAIHSRSLEPDDIGTLVDTYPGPPDTTVGDIHGEIRVGKRKARRGVAVFALDGPTGRVVASGLTDDAGRYRIRALPPGPYLLAATSAGHPGTMVPYWRKAPLVEAAFHVETPAGGTPRPAVVTVRAGAPEVHKDIVVAKPPRDGTGEPDDGPELARELPYRGAAVGAFERPLDEDWFVLRVPDGAPVDIRVRSWGMGSTGDADLTVYRADGTTPISYVLDDRPAIYPWWANGPLGTDQDCSIDRIVVPDGEVLVRVRIQQDADPGDARSFYVLSAFPSAGVPWAENTSVSVTPGSLRAGGDATAVLHVTPRDVYGTPLPAGASVELTRSDGGGPAALEPLGDGSFRGIVAAPAVPGPVFLAVTVRTQEREIALPSAALLQGAGPPDGLRSPFLATPRRIEADGNSQSTLRLVPVDGAGLALGRSLGLSIVFDGAPAGTLGSTVDDGTGAYTATLRAPATPGRAKLTAIVDGQPTGVSRTVGFGYDLVMVAGDLGVEIAAGTARPGLTKAEARTLGGAGARLQSMLGALDAGDPPAAAAAAASAVALLAKAGDATTLPEGGTGAAELAEALRRRVRTVISSVGFPDPNPKGERALGKARALLAKGESLLLAGDPVPGAKQLAKSLKAIGKYLP